jgi:predicted nucleotidyltransferase
MPAKANKDDVETYRKKLRDMMPVLKEEYSISYIGLFGSFVRKENTPKSDLDLLVEFSKTLTISKFVHLENHLSDSLGVKVDLVMKDALKPNIGKYILKEVEAI